jgi:hypothetical protein
MDNIWHRAGEWSLKVALTGARCLLRFQAGDYSGMRHYLRAIKTAGTVEPFALVAA